MPACPTPVWCFEWVAACASNPVTQKPNGRHTLELNRYMIYRYSWKLDTFSHSLFQNFFFIFFWNCFTDRGFCHIVIQMLKNLNRLKTSRETQLITLITLIQIQIPSSWIPNIWITVYIIVKKSPRKVRGVWPAAELDEAVMLKRMPPFCD